ncbi:Methyltransferase domain-containing protein [Clostridium acidisoli DSM 12555]|uniref:Methyltransferase domain-containing protein n=1 Tax=Clostridium acidisoli DSM 12555 TaxID=1121291 RepID=A0A1W1WZA4_9CLOT|nr:class I SAM-dependent methyltransferase [Clostridium acidisoli]SMC16778.1 Methyltransferase domain-containing protein [Clostridium acidisoli DSM 12555]
MEKHQCNSKETQQLERKIKFLNGVERRKEFPPEEVLQMLAIKKTDNILDLGAGTGYLTIPVAQMVHGLVYALDMDEKMLEIIDCKAQDESITNIQLVKGSIDNIPLPDDSIDIVLASLVLHEIKPLSTTLQQIKRVLKDGGQFMCLEYEKNESAIEGPPMQIRVPSLVMEQELKNAGLNITQKIFLRKKIYIITAKK